MKRGGQHDRRGEDHSNQTRNVLSSFVVYRQASFVATTSTAEALCLSLGADVVINYRENNW